MGFLLSATSNASDSSEQLAIKNLISSTFDKPELKVITSPVVVVDHYAIADWVQGEKGGRALLHETNGKWSIMACGGDGFKDVKTLINAGIKQSIAQQLISQLNQAELPLSPIAVKRFSLYGAEDEAEASHHSH
ncbi:hypothetical protein ZMTM_07570 [Methyloradius palustris]|uniref:Copper uptake system-associated protein n=2 Tax=Methyloradius palustris TaxID=2778876 RepID=A0A8D5GBK5_9PROT|nr:hypothetical protein ZMTM_07570 [Methyloradius palustris]